MHLPNDQCASMARIAVEAYRVAVGYDQTDDVATIISDLLADVRHLCANDGLDWTELDEQAELRYREEEQLQGLPSQGYYLQGTSIVDRNGYPLYEDVFETLELSRPAAERLAQLHSDDPTMTWERAAQILNHEGLVVQAK